VGSSARWPAQFGMRLQWTLANERIVGSNFGLALASVAVFCRQLGCGRSASCWPVAARMATPPLSGVRKRALCKCSMPGDLISPGPVEVLSVIRTFRTLLVEQFQRWRAHRPVHHRARCTLLIHSHCLKAPFCYTTPSAEYSRELFSSRHWDRSRGGTISS